MIQLTDLQNIPEYCRMNVQSEIIYALFPFEALLCSQSQVNEVEEENSQLHLQVKKLNEEYRSRLVCYLQDLAVSSNKHRALKLASPESEYCIIYLHIF